MSNSAIELLRSLDSLRDAYPNGLPKELIASKKTQVAEARKGMHLAIVPDSLSPDAENLLNDIITKGLLLARDEVLVVKSIDSVVSEADRAMAIIGVLIFGAGDLDSARLKSSLPMSRASAALPALSQIGKDVNTKRAAWQILKKYLKDING